MNGAILSIISWILLLYLVSVNVVVYSINPSFTNTYSTSTLDVEDPVTYKIEPESMLAMTQLSDSLGSIPTDEIESYVGGVYL